MQTIGKRIDLLCSELDCSRRKFAEKIQEKPSTIASIVRGSSPSANIICSILNTYPDLSERWLLMGEGSIWKEKNTGIGLAQETLEHQLLLKEETIAALKGQVAALEKTVLLLEKQLELSERQKTLKIKAS